MRTHSAILHFIAALACAAAILAAPARSQVGEAFRMEAGAESPNCAENGSSPLCQVERSLDRHFGERTTVEPEPMFTGLIDWLFGLEGNRHASPRPPGRDSVVAPVAIHYHVERLETLDAADIAALPTRWHPDSPPHGLRPGAVRIEILVAFEDAYGMRWPPKGWHVYEYLLREPDSGRGLHTEALEPSRTIALRWARSDCVGSAETPLCAVETFLACRVRQDDAHCHGVDESLGRDVRWATSVSYHVAAIDAVADEGRPPGHAYTVTLEEWDLHRRRDSGGEEYVRYLAVRSEDGWRVVGRSVIDWKLPQDPG